MKGKLPALDGEGKIVVPDRQKIPLVCPDRRYPAMPMEVQCVGAFPDKLIENQPDTRWTIDHGAPVLDARFQPTIAVVTGQ
jgi:hypothetical protein